MSSEAKKTVVVVSNNNSATRNVAKKLEKKNGAVQDVGRNIPMMSFIDRLTRKATTMIVMTALYKMTMVKESTRNFPWSVVQISYILNGCIYK